MGRTLRCPAVDLHAEVLHLLARYCHTVDGGLWDEFAELWSADATFSAVGNTRQGPADIVGFLEVAQAPSHRGKHVTINTAVSVEGLSDTVSAVSDFLFVAAGEGPQDWRITQVGRYLDAFVRGTDGMLRFAAREVQLGLPSGN
jgi:3-phenylpropionate/cinnamic acid dioxygenase small subunit